MFRRHMSTEYDPEHYVLITNAADACLSYTAKYNSESVSGIHNYKITMLNAITTQPQGS